MLPEDKNFQSKIPPDLLRAYSKGQLTRRELAERIGEPLTFGQVLQELQETGLPLPRIPSDPRSAGVQVVRELTIQAMKRAG